MAVNDNEGLGDKIVDFFTQKPDDHEYEKAGGDDRVPEHERTDDPKADANRFAAAAGEPLPYPNYDEGEPVFDGDAEEAVVLDEPVVVEETVQTTPDVDSEAHVVDDQGRPL